VIIEDDLSSISLSFVKLTKVSIFQTVSKASKNHVRKVVWLARWLLDLITDRSFAASCYRNIYSISRFFNVIFSLFTWSKQSDFYGGPAQKALIGWKKAGPPKPPLLFSSCKQANCALEFYLVFYVYKINMKIW